MFLKLFITPLLLLSFLANADCSKSLSSLLKRSEKTLSALAQEIALKSKNIDTLSKDEMYLIFDRLKSEEEIFFDSYLNRSAKKRKMFESEIQEIRTKYNLSNLNEIYKLYSLIDDAIIEIDTLDILRKINFEQDKDAYAAIFHTLNTIRGNINIREMGVNAKELFDNLPQLTEEQAKKIISIYKSYKSKASNKEDIDLYQEFTSIGLGSKAALIQSQFEKRKAMREICCKTGTGCTFCPNNLGLRFKNKQ